MFQGGMQGVYSLFVGRYSCVRPVEAGFATARKDETKHCLELVAGSPGGAPEMAIQVYADLSDPSTLEREVIRLRTLQGSFSSRVVRAELTPVQTAEGEAVLLLRLRLTVFTLVSQRSRFRRISERINYLMQQILKVQVALLAF